MPYRAILNDVDAPLVNDFSEQTMREFRAKTLVLDARRARPEPRSTSMRDAADAPARLDGARAADRERERREPVPRARLGARRRDRRARVARRVEARGCWRCCCSRCCCSRRGAALASLPLTLIALRGIRQSAAGFAATRFDFELNAPVVAS